MALNIGSLGAFLGGNNGQGGIMQQLNAAAAQRQKQQQQQDQVRALLAGLQTQGAGQPGAAPPAQPAPQQAPPPMQGPNLPAMASAMPPTPGALPPSVAQSAPQIGGPPSAAMAGADPMAQGQQAMIRILMSSGDPEAKLAALDQYSKNIDPLTKMATQLEMKSQQVDAQKGMLDQKLQELRDLQAMRNQQSGENTDKRVAATERGQDIVSGDKTKNSQLQYDKMNGVDLRGEMTSITQQLTNNPKLTSDERKDLQSQWQAAKTALDKKRTAQGLPPDRAKPPTPDEQVKAAAGSDTPVVITKEQFDKLPSGATYKESDGNTYTKP